MLNTINGHHYFQPLLNVAIMVLAFNMVNLD